MKFGKVEKHYIPDQIFDALKQEILEHRLVAGEKLPSESILSKQFGVSKTSVKTALQRLSTLGFIETRVGQGSFVLEFNPQQYLDQVHDFLLSDGDIANINEYRMYVEMAATRLAIKRATKDNFKKMEAILVEMQEAFEQEDVELHGRLDYLFHLEIWKSTQNAVFEMAYSIIGRMLLNHITALSKEYYDKEKNTRTWEDDIHRDLLEAIKNKDLEQCRNCYKTMFSVQERISSDHFQDS